MPGGSAGAAVTGTPAVTALARARRPYHDTADPTTSRPAPMSIATWKASIDAWFDAATCAGRGPGRRRVERLERLADRRIGRVEAGRDPERGVERRADDDEDERPDQRLADPRDRVVDGRPETGEASRDRAHQGARQRRDDARDAEPEQEREGQDVDQDAGRRDEAGRVLDRRRPGRRIDRQPRVPEQTAGHQQRSGDEEPARADAAGDRPDPRRQHRQHDPDREADDPRPPAPCSRGRPAG